MRTLFVVLGSVFVGLGVIGIFLPVLPTTPFLLLAAACFVRGSERLYRWLLDHPVFGATIRNYREGRGLTARVKLTSIPLIWLTIEASAVLVVPLWPVKLALLVIATSVSFYLGTRRTVGRPAGSVRRRFVEAALLVGVSAAVAHTLVITGDGLIDETPPSDVAVIFGNQVHEDGTPSRRLAARLERGLELYRGGVVPVLLVSGGVGREGHDEALVMRDTLVARGIPEGDVWVDQDGYDTFETAQHTRALLPEGGSAIAVTQYYHVTRAKMALRRAGVERVGGAHARMGPELRDPYSILREIVGYWVYVVRYASM